MIELRHGYYFDSLADFDVMTNTYWVVIELRHGYYFDSLHIGL